MMEYYLAIKKNGIMLFAGKWIIMLGKVTRFRKTKVKCFFTYVEAKPKR
jgi:hypothetical protein